jgi:hypothetical protein
MVNGSQLFDGLTVFIVVEREIFKGRLVAENGSEGAHHCARLLRQAVPQTLPQSCIVVPRDISPKNGASCLRELETD